MNISQQLRVLREGTAHAFTEDKPNLELNEELVESWFINPDIFLNESVIETPMVDLIVEMTTLMESGTATPDETLTLLGKIKAKMQNFKSKFDPFEGLRDLRLIRERIEAVSIIRRHVIIPLIGPYLGIMAYGKKVKDMDEKDIKAFLSEAEKMRGVLFNKLKKAKSQNDTQTVEYLERILKKLDNQINGFTADMKHFGRM